MSAGQIDIDAMRTAAARFTAAKSAGDATAQRTAIADTLSVLMDVTRMATAQVGDGAELRRPLLALLAALADANAGRANDLLRPAKRSRAGAGSLAAMKVEAYANVAATVTVLMEVEGMDEAAAIKHVKQRLSTGGVQLPGDLATMRDKVMNGERGERAREAYFFMVAFLKGRGNTPEQNAEIMLDTIIRLHGAKKLP